MTFYKEKKRGCLVNKYNILQLTTKGEIKPEHIQINDSKFIS